MKNILITVIVLMVFAARPRTKVMNKKTVRPAYLR